MKRFVKAADENTAEEVFKDKLSSLKSDFEYAIDGLDKLSDDGYQNDASDIADTLSADLDEVLTAIAEIIAK